VNPADFEYLRKLLKARSGLFLTADKQYLLESRLLPIARKVGVPGLAELTQKLRAPNAEALIAQVVEAMTTNETYFFRDKLPFEHFRETMLPALLAARATQRRLRIWCAACSTGQEPYSLAMSLSEMAGKLAGWKIDILATDLSGEVLEKAKGGIYTQFEVQRGLPIHLLLKYFTQVGDQWQIAPKIRTMVQFRPINLLRDFSNLGAFDIVFCRNVLIYFEQETKVAVLDQMARVIEPDGYLVLGAAETVVGLTGNFKPHADKRGLYAPVAKARTAPTPLRVVADAVAPRTVLANAR
jgi:chemotaxis protein methyltransferase CheR